MYETINQLINHQRCADKEIQGKNEIARLTAIDEIIFLVFILSLIDFGRDIISARIAQSNQKIAQEAHALKLYSHVNNSTPKTIRLPQIQLII